MTYINKRHDDWSSHAADAFRMGAIMIRNKINQKRLKLEAKAITEFDAFQEI